MYNVSDRKIEVLNMVDEPKRWQVRIWTGEDTGQSVTIYGDSISKLQHAVGDWLRKNNFTHLGNAHQDYEITRRYNYAYSDPPDAPLYQTHLESGKWIKEPLPEGWYWVKGSVDYWNAPQRLNDS